MARIQMQCVNRQTWAYGVPRRGWSNTLGRVAHLQSYSLTHALNVAGFFPISMGPDIRPPLLRHAWFAQISLLR